MKERKVEKRTNDDWVECHFRELKIGDTFRMFEPNGEPVYDEEDNDEFYVIGNPFWDDGVWTCNVARQYK